MSNGVKKVRGNLKGKADKFALLVYSVLVNPSVLI